MILLVDAFFERVDKRSIAIAAIGRSWRCPARQFLSRAGASRLAGRDRFLEFYTADPLAIFFKRFALVTTIFVLIMMIDYAPIVRARFMASRLRQGSANSLPCPSSPAPA